MEMLHEFLLFYLILCPSVLTKRRQHEKKDSSNELGGQLITALRNDANLDLSMDEEYEDLRAELLAYHTALSSLAETRADTGGLPREVAEAVAAEPGNNIAVETRRSMKTTPCWRLGGICIEFKLCVGHKFMSEVNGCKTNLEVCCFAWNKYQMREFVDQGISNMALPWSHHYEFGVGKGLISPADKNVSESESKQQNAEHKQKQEHTEEPEEIFSSKELLKRRLKHKPALLLVVNQDKK